MFRTMEKYINISQKHLAYFQEYIIVTFTIVLFRTEIGFMQTRWYVDKM